jgi:hypothetical protein
MKKWLKITGLVFLALLTGLFIWIGFNLKDRHPGYSTNLKIINQKASPLQAGFAALTITPEVPDNWQDKNNNALYEPDKGDTFTDGNGNGVFDPVWIAGFSNNKAANGIHDDLWARTMIIDDGTTRLAIVSIDAIGLMNDYVIDIRNQLPSEAGITYLIITSTHNHEAPDLMGLWGESMFKSGVNPEYLTLVKNQIVQSVLIAVRNLRPAHFEISEDLTGAIPLVKDTRKPEVFDSGLRLIKAVDKENGNTLGCLISWADHAETLWSKNLLITSDFVHYFREGVEKGVFKGDSIVKKGIGGVAVYVNGAIGGLMTTHSSLAVKDPLTNEEHLEPSFEKAEAQGRILSLLALSAMEKPAATIDSAAISIVAKNIILPIQNPLFKLGTALGVLDRGTTGWMKIRTEISAFTFGSLSFVSIPGEIYPEIVNGGIESPEGRDFSIQPLEVPAVRELMKGKHKFILGLANDEIGYIIPKSQWDVKAPYTYKTDNSPYGEENSVGSETAPLIHSGIMEILKEFK